MCRLLKKQKDICDAVFTLINSRFPYGKIAETPVRLFVVLEDLGDLGDRSNFESLLLVFVFLLLCVLPDFNRTFLNGYTQ